MKKAIARCLLLLSISLNLVAIPAKELITSGENYLRAGKYSKAEAAYQEILQSEANNLSALLGLAKVKLLTRELVEAKKFIDLANLVNAKDLNVLIVQGQYYQIQGDPDKASQFFNEVIQIDKSNKQAGAGLALLVMDENSLDPYAENDL